MPQNLVSVAISNDEAAQLRDAVTQLVGALQPKTIALDNDARRELLKMGGKSEAFGRQVFTVLQQNRQLVPPSLGLDDAAQDWHTLDALRPLLADLEQLVERLRDTEMALRSDLMVFNYEGYALLKVVGKQQGLDGQLKDLGMRFQRNGRKEAIPPAA